MVNRLCGAGCLLLWDKSIMLCEDVRRHMLVKLMNRLRGKTAVVCYLLSEQAWMIYNE